MLIESFKSNYMQLFPLGLFSSADPLSMVSEITKMQDLQHTNVMSLIGVCLDRGGRSVSIVMPFMANGSLLSYLKKQRSELELDSDCEEEQVRISESDII